MPQAVAVSSLESALPSGMRATRATRAMLALLRSSAQERFSAAEVEAALARKCVAVNRVTVFRALDRLHQAGMLQKKVGDDRVNRYQWLAQEARTVAQAQAAALQVRWQCVQCQQVQEVAVDHGVLLAAHVLAQGCSTQSPTQGLQHIQLQGLCTDCAG